MRDPRGIRAGRRPSSGLTIAIAALGLAMAAQAGMASVKVRTDFNKDFNFQQAHTWGWRPGEPGQIILARSKDDDPDAVKKAAEPIIMAAVATEMPARGLTQAAVTATPDLTLTYYLLMTVGNSAQTMGQFLPATTAWGLPLFAPQTTSLEMIERGSIVLDLSAKGDVVWRGVGEAKLDMDLNREKRAALIREAVREILKRYPPKK
jgi:hypothetical protein